MNPDALSNLPAAPAQTLLGFHFTEALLWKACGSLVLGIAGMYCLLKGKENQSLSAMLWGGALILVSLFFF